MKSVWVFGGLVSLGAFFACGGGSSGNPDAGDAAGPTCDPHGTSGTTFVDATQAWGLGSVVGNRIVSADLDGDGYPDLIIHAIGSNNRETIGQPPKLVWVLMNRPNPSGGRQFVDATQDSGLFQIRGGSTTEYRSAHLASVGDIDNDGDLDVFSGTYVDPTNPTTDTGDRSEILLNDGTGHFTLAPISDPHPPATALWPTTGATMTDVDRDGKIDLFVGFWYQSYGTTYQGFQAQLYAGHGDGTFTTNTGNAGLTTQNAGFAQNKNSKPSYGVTSCDLDGDGSPELMVSAYGRQWNFLYQNDGTGKFSEVGQAAGYASDSDIDYMHRLSPDMGPNQFFLCYCTLHATEPDCAGVEKPATSCPSPADSYWAHGTDDQPWRNGGNNFSTYCGDIDGDGKLDVYTAGIHHWHIGQSGDSSELLVNTSPGDGTITFNRPGNATTGMVWPHPTSDWNEGGLMVAGGDLDNDGLEDLVVAASDYPDQFGLVFHQKPDHTFEEVGAQWGLHHACMSGLTIADFDRDGDLDVVVGSGTARDCGTIWKTNEVHLYENKGASAQKWIQMKLVGDGVTANKSAFGARVTLAAGGLTQVKERDGSYGHMSMQNDTILSFGLGQCAQTDSVTVRWPDQALTSQTFSGLQAGKRYELRMGDASPHEVP
jgi:enediyne biosynthesis protein E4